MSEALKGVDRWEAAVDRMLDDLDYITRRAVSEGAKAAKDRIRGHIGGPPRWLHGRHEARSGGPGEISMKLRKRTSYTRPVQEAWGVYTTRLRSKARYARRVEGLYPYFRPGWVEAERDMQEAFERNWTRVLAKNYG